MAEENMTQDLNSQLGKKITVKLKPLALEKATGGQPAAPVNIPAAPAGASASATVRFDKAAVAAAEPEMPSAQDMAKRTIKLTPPPRSGMPKPPAMEAPAAPATPKKATQVVKVSSTPAAPVAVAAAAPTIEVAAPVAITATSPTIETGAPAATQAVKKPGLTMPKAAPVAAAAPAAPAAITATAPTVETGAPAATQAVKKPGLTMPKAAPVAAAAPAAPAAITATAPTVETGAPAATQAVKKPGLTMPTAAPAAPVTDAPQAVKKPGLTMPTAAPAPAAAEPEITLSPEEEAKKVQSEGLKPRENGGSGLGLKKVEQVAEADLPEGLRPADGVAQPVVAAEPGEGGVYGTFEDADPIDLEKLDEPKVGFTIVSVVACILLLLGVYIMFAHYSKLWMPGMDGNEVPQPPAGLLIK